FGDLIGCTKCGCSSFMLFESICYQFATQSIGKNPGKNRVTSRGPMQTVRKDELLLRSALYSLCHAFDVNESMPRKKFFKLVRKRLRIVGLKGINLRGGWHRRPQPLEQPISQRDGLHEVRICS